MDVHSMLQEVLHNKSLMRMHFQGYSSESGSDSGKSELDEEYYKNRLPIDIDFSKTFLVRAQSYESQLSTHCISGGDKLMSKNTALAKIQNSSVKKKLHDSQHSLNQNRQDQHSKNNSNLSIPGSLKKQNCGHRSLNKINQAQYVNNYSDQGQPRQKINNPRIYHITTNEEDKINNTPNLVLKKELQHKVPNDKNKDEVNSGVKDVTAVNKINRELANHKRNVTEQDSAQRRYETILQQSRGYHIIPSPDVDLGNQNGPPEESTKWYNLCCLDFLCCLC